MAHGFSDIVRQTRLAAMDMSTNWALVTKDLSVDISHPVAVMAAYRDRLAKESAPADAPEVTIVATPKFATHRDAVKFIKVDQRAETDDEGSAIAKRRRAAIAKSKDTTVEALRKEASATAPDEAYRFNPTAQKAIDSMRSNLRGSAAAMELDGLTKAQIKDIFLQFANSL